MFRDLSEETLFKTFLQTGIVLLLFRPHVVIGMGGYASFPPVFLASILGKILPISTLIHEQNALAGLTNRLLARFVDKVLISYPQTKAQFSSARNVITTGNPVRNEFFVARRTPAVYKSFGLLQDKKTVLVFGGSNGSSALTNAVRKNKEQIARDKDIQVLLVTGKLADTSMIELELAAAGVTNIVCKTYIKRMGDAFAVADLVVSRAGASTLAEITSCGKPSILIPLGKSADGHQLANARVLGDKRGCAVIEEDNFLDRRLAQLIEQMIRDKQRLSLMAERSMCMGNRNAAASMLGEVVAVVEGGRT